MSRRRKVAIVSAGLILGIGLALAAVVVGVTQTSYGREQVRRVLVGRIASSMGERGSMYIGRISGGFLNGVVLDSFAIRDEDDSLFVSAARVLVEYDARDLMDKRLLIKRLVVERPVVNLRRHANGQWNYKRIFPSGPKSPLRPERKFGDFIVLDSAEIRDAYVMVTEPWKPADSLRGPRRDSAVAVAVATYRCEPEFWRTPQWLERPCGREIRHTSEGLKRTYRWRIHELIASYARIADPDSAGRLFAIAKLSADEPDPPFSFRNITGPVRLLGDTLEFEARHFDLPASTGSARGTVRWGSGPMRYNIDVTGDSVSLVDVNWVYPTLPKTGGGTMKLHIQNSARNPRVLEYALSEMDVRTTGSRLRGAMTFAVGEPVLVVKDVALRAEPVDFALIRVLNGKPFPVDWAGQINGTVRASGGPLNRWQVNEARFQFNDAHVPGAVTRGTARGGLNIIEPSLTEFRGLDLQLETFDLRTIRYLYPNFARLGGTVSGSATLDSSWLDVRFRNADLTHHDGPHAPSRFTGSGRVTYTTKIVYDAQLEAAPISFTTLARSYPIIPFRRTYSGPLRIQGVLDSLLVVTSLSGPAGQAGFSGYVDGDSAQGYAAHGVTRFENLDAGVLIGSTELPATRFTGEMSSDVRFDSLANMVGTLAVNLERSSVDSVMIFPSAARLTFGAGRMRVDSLRVESSVATLTASGAIGIDPAVGDSLRYAIRVDSLGGLRAYLRPRIGSRGAEVLADADSTVDQSARDSLIESLRDSLAGTVMVEGTLAGSLDTLHAAGEITSNDLFVGGDQTRHVQGDFAIGKLPSTPTGSARVTFEQLVASGVRLASASASVAVDSAGGGRVSVQAQSETGPAFWAAVGVDRSSGTMRLAIDSLGARIGERAWALATPAFATFDSTIISVDSLLLLDGGGSSVVVDARIPLNGPISAKFLAERLPLSDVSAIAQLDRPLAGVVSLAIGVTGTRTEPLISIRAGADSVRSGSLRLPRVTLVGDYAGGRMETRLQLFQDTQPILGLTGSLPVNLALAPVENRLPEDSLRARIFADSVDLALIEAISPEYIRRASGLISTDVEIAGTWKRPSYAGRLAVNRGDVNLPKLGIRLRQLEADVGLGRDSIRFTRFSAVSGEEDGTILLRGGIALPTGSLFDYERIAFNLHLQADNFQAIQLRRVADLAIGGSLDITGPFSRARLTGGLTIPRGALYIRDESQKQLVALDDPDFLQVVDTSDISQRRLFALPTAVDNLIENLAVDNVSITLGDDVWLRSAAANIKLGGRVGVEKTGQRLALDGTLLANRGQYRLDLGPVNRRFDVTSGSIIFYGEPGFDPALDITAVYTVRQPDREDVRIRANIGGTLQNIRLSLSSDERIAISTTEILSYLVFGAPSFALGDQNTSRLRPFASALLPTAGALLEEKLSEEFGGFIDLFQIQAGGYQESSEGIGQSGRAIASASRIGIGTQWGDRTFVTANAGLCGLSKGGSNVRFEESLGLSVERRIGRTASAQLGMEPAASALVCERGHVEINTPRQFGFDLFREWSF
ncbi:MAG: translocation/assembly module TamB [Anaerolineae bacterium]|nr:translocation/assembly module TamB [Gemmatimonadaceae bacterium]